MRRPHVLVDARFSESSRGGDRCRFELARGLIGSSDIRCTFLVYPHGKSVLQLLDSSVSTVTTPHLPSRHPQADLFEHITLPNLCRKLEVELYHGTFQVMPWRRPARVMIATIHDMALFDFPNAYSRKFGPYMRLLLRRSINTSDRLIAVSNATAEAIVNRFPNARSKIKVVYNGVGAEFSAPISAAMRSQVVKKYSLPESFILFVGNLERKKNLAKLIRAYLLLRKTSAIEESLVIVGDRPDNLPSENFDEVFGASAGQQDWQSRCKSAGVHFIGYVADLELPVIYSLARAAAYPSLYEGFGMPVLEAMAAGVPVLTSSISSLPEVAKGAAWLVDPNSIELIAEGLREVLHNQWWRQSAILRGRKRAAELTWDRNARETEQLYLSAMGS